MTDEKTEPIPPIIVNVIGTGDGGASPLMTGDIGKTADHLPNLVIGAVITPLVAISVRFAFMFVKSLLGYLTLAMVPAGTNPVLIAIHGMDFYHLVLTGIGLSIAPTVYDLLQSLVTVLGKLERKYPVATGSV